MSSPENGFGIAIFTMALIAGCTALEASGVEVESPEIEAVIVTNPLCAPGDTPEGPYTC